MLSTLDVLVAGLCAASAKGFEPDAFLRKIFSFVPFVSPLVALALMPMHYPDWLDTLLRRLGATLVPLALVSVGFQLRLSAIRGRIPLLAIGLGFKLIVGVAIVAMDHELDPSLVTLMVGLGIPLSFAALPAWWWLLQGLA